MRPVRPPLPITFDPANTLESNDMNVETTLHSATQIAPKDHNTEALVLSCMDFRMMDPVADFLSRKGLKGKYDMVAIAGAAIGVMNDAKPAWGELFWDHVGLARDLHGIRRVIVIDHRDCGACKAFVSSDCASDRQGELEIHTKWLTDLMAEVTRRAPDLEVELFLMDLDGTVEEITC